MGFKIDTYSLDELQKISVPGAVVPSLFWVLPIGNWNGLHSLWDFFTHGNSRCHDFGLLLVKDFPTWEEENFEINLETVGAKLSDLLPSGAKHWNHTHPLNPDKSQMLILSGGYPQPGWGVLMDWTESHRPRRFEELVERVFESMHIGQNKLNVFQKVNKSYHDLQRLLNNEPWKPNDISKLETEIQRGEKFWTLIDKAENALANGLPYEVQKQIAAYTAPEPRPLDWDIIDNETLHKLVNLQTQYANAAFILTVSEEQIDRDIIPRLEALIATTVNRQIMYQNIHDSDLKHALRVCYHLRIKSIVHEGESFHTWATHTKNEAQPKLVTLLAQLKQQIDEKLQPLQGKLQQQGLHFNRQLSAWRENCREARQQFHVDLDQTLKLQWEMGPDFLVAFEKQCRSEGITVSSISWDPARMIGWKLFAAHETFTDQDLLTVAQEIAPNLAMPNRIHGQNEIEADGGYFTDYVHYIAISNIGFNPRSITRDLIANLSRPGRLKQLIQDYGGHVPEDLNGVARVELAEILLNTLGWMPTEELFEKPLAGCIYMVNEIPVLLTGVSANDLRRVIESFCKDLTDVLVAKLGYKEDQIWHAIWEKLPDYQPYSYAEDWYEEVGLMTSGSASILLPILGSLAFPDQTETITALVQTLRQLSKQLNHLNHHNAMPPLIPEGAEPAELIQQLLDLTESIIGEMPWHMKTSFVYGDHPKVLSGEAWSHGSPIPKLLRVLEWTGATYGSHVTFWNTTRQNPIVPNALFIHRPGSSN